MPENESSVAPVRVLSKRNKTIGMFFILGPWIGLALILASWAVVSFLMSQQVAVMNSYEMNAAGQMIPAVGDSRTAILRIVNVGLGFLGILCVIGILIGVPLGLVFMRKRDLTDSSVYDQRSGKGDASVVPEEIKGWSWGAAGLTWIWGIYHNVWISLLSFIPLVNLVMIVYLGLKGNELAWRSNRWTSVEEFKSAQGKWQTWGIIFFILGVLSFLSSFSSNSPGF